MLPVIVVKNSTTYFILIFADRIKASFTSMDAKEDKRKGI
jgi:multisubunit Na+/H+ antiporter MnhC subunit